MSAPDALRAQLADALAWGQGHASLDDAIKGLPAALRGKRAARFPHSPWELVEHIRRGQHDLLDFCRNADYKELHWPDDYWPPTPAPPSARAWADSIAGYKKDRAEFQAMIKDPTIDLGARIPHGTGQTYAREVLIAIDHASYHVGQLVAVRRALGAWG
jgi:DinB superfamily